MMEPHLSFMRRVAEAYGRLDGEVIATFRRRGGSLLAEQQQITLRHKGKVVYHGGDHLPRCAGAADGRRGGPYPRTMVPAGGIATALRLLPWEPKARFAIPVWLTAIVHWPLDMRVEARIRSLCPQQL